MSLINLSEFKENSNKIHFFDSIHLPYSPAIITCTLIIEVQKVENSFKEPELPEAGKYL